MNAGWKSPSDTSYVGQQWGELDGTNNSDRGHNGDAEAHDVEQPQKKKAKPLNKSTKRLLQRVKAQTKGKA